MMGNVHCKGRWWIGSVLAALVLLSSVAATAQAAEPVAKPVEPAGRYNVLMIAVDDLRPELGCYGSTVARSPNIDRLARAGTLFNRAYVQQAVCSPSRTSLLTGRRPDTTRVYDLETHFRLHVPDIVTLPQYFKNHGYHTQSLGKVYHGGLDDPASWSVQSWHPTSPQYATPESLAIVEADRQRLQAAGRLGGDRVIERDAKTGQVLKVARNWARPMGPSWEAPDVPDSALADGQIAEKAVEVLREVGGRRFFLAVGFLRPHLPFVAPKRYFDLHPADAVRTADNPFPPKDAPAIALTDWRELRNYSDSPKSGPLTENQTRALVRAYHAATSYTDAQIGRVLDELDRQGLRENTVVVLWGDHGWHLGEHGLWCKHTNFEVATRAPLIFSAPGQKHAGTKTDALAEFVDVYPTLCDLAGLPVPEGPEGASLAPILNDPSRLSGKPAISQYPRGKAMGYSMRTDRYRYTEWIHPQDGQVGVELYDHQADPNENVNVAGRPDSKTLCEDLHRELMQHAKLGSGAR